MRKIKFMLCMLLAVLFIGCDDTAKDPVADTTVTIEDKTISISEITSTSVTLSWKKATSKQDDKKVDYAVYQSEKDNIKNIADVEKNGTKIRDYADDLIKFKATNLNAATTYYFTVVARDSKKQKAQYEVKSVQTTLPKTKGEYTIETAKTGALDLKGVKGTINLNEEGAGDRILSIKGFEYTGSKLELSGIAFNVTLENPTGSPIYLITLKKQDIVKNIPLSVPVSLEALDSQKKAALGVTALTSIQLEDATKTSKYTVTVEPINEYDYKGTKYPGSVGTKDGKAELKVSITVTIKVATTFANANELLDSVKDTALKASLKNLYGYSGLDQATLLKKTVLQTLITNTIAKLKAGASQSPIALGLTATK